MAVRRNRDLNNWEGILQTKQIMLFVTLSCHLFSFLDGNATLRRTWSIKMVLVKQS